MSGLQTPSASADDKSFSSWFVFFFGCGGGNVQEIKDTMKWDNHFEKLFHQPSSSSLISSISFFLLYWHCPHLRSSWQIKFNCTHLNYSHNPKPFSPPPPIRIALGFCFYVSDKMKRQERRWWWYKGYMEILYIAHVPNIQMLWVWACAICVGRSQWTGTNWCPRRRYGGGSNDTICNLNREKNEHLVCHLINAIKIILINFFSPLFSSPQLSHQNDVHHSGSEGNPSWEHQDKFKCNFYKFSLITLTQSVVMCFFTASKLTHKPT